MQGWGRISSSEAAAQMMPLVEQALSLDGDLVEAWQLLAYVRWKHDDIEGARAADKRALELDPQNPVVLQRQIFRWSWTHEPERGLVYADELLRVDPLSPLSIGDVVVFYTRLGRFDDAQRMNERLRSLDPLSPGGLWTASGLASSRGDLTTALRLMEEAYRLDPNDPEIPSFTARFYFNLGDAAAANSWNDAALQLDPEAPYAMIMAALLHLHREEEAEAVAIARKLTAPNSFNRWGSRGIALRIVAAPDLAAGNHEEIITRYLTHYPELAEGKFPTRPLFLRNHSVWEAFLVTLDLASVYLHAGERAKAESLLSLVESELPHWPRTGLWVWGYGFADVELHALRGEKEEALAALQEHAKTGMRQMWRWQVLYNPNLESIRDTPEFAAIVAEIEADMAEQLARVREMEKNGELEPIPELAAE
jgi:tetratricopeptide (TPR) repeat protein